MQFFIGVCIYQFESFILMINSCSDNFTELMMRPSLSFKFFWIRIQIEQIQDCYKNTFTHKHVGL